jgi:hypothetical protein
MRKLLLMTSLCFGAAGSLMLSGQPLPRNINLHADIADKSLAEMGLYPVFCYQGRPHFAKDLVNQKERWEGIIPAEEVKYLPSWVKYENRRFDSLLLVADGDNVVYVAKKQNFEVIGYIKKKGFIKRLGGGFKGSLLHGLEGSPIHILLSLFGLG